MYRLQDTGRDSRTPDGLGATPLNTVATGGGFRPAWWCRSPHLQTLWPHLFRWRPRPAYHRERLELPDGDFLDLDWCGPRAKRGLVLILHGLEGSSNSHYVRGLAHTLAAAGIASVAMHQRGCSGEPNRLARFYHAGETGDLHRVLEHCRHRHPAAELYAVGYSLGGNILLNWLAQAAKPLLTAAAAVSVPYRLEDGARRLESGLSRLYQARLVRGMKRSVARKGRRMAHPVDARLLAAARSFEQIDNCLTAPLHGFRDAQDYYTRCSARQYLGAIRTPTLLIHARDDPFMTPDTAPRPQELPAAVQLELSRHGGHCGFIAGGLPLRPRYWAEARLLAFIQAQGAAGVPASG